MITVRIIVPPCLAKAALRMYKHGHCGSNRRTRAAVRSLIRRRVRFG
jgi:hypothetical protein